MSVPQSVRDNMTRFDSDYQGPAKGFSQLPNARELPDGIYTCEVMDAELGETPQSREVRFSLTIEATNMRGQSVLCEIFHLLKSSEAYSYLARDLKGLGFDTVNWTVANRRPFAAELLKVLDGKKLPGLRFQGTRSTYEDRAGANQTKFDINGLLKNASKQVTASPAAATTVAPAAAANGRQSQAAAPTTTATKVGKVEDIPF